VQASLRIGCVKYLNARPLIRGWGGDVCLENPAVLCAKLAADELDVALVSSFEFLRNPVYQIVDDVSISSDGPVYSVIVAHRGNISQIEDIELDPASETSVNLLRCLLAERRLSPRLVEGGASFDKLRTSSATSQRDIRGLAGARPSTAQLLIGDQAIRFRRDHPEFQFWDLGEEWKKSVGLPFVYALWLIRPEVLDARTIANRLRAVRDKNLTNLDQLIAAEEEFERDFCDHYYREHLRFTFGEREKEGLQTFQKLCAKHGLLPRREIKFVLV
jgi:predicted solute-binding protein